MVLEAAYGIQNAARDILRSHGIAQQDIETVWTAIALHTTPGIPQHMHPVIALVTAGVEVDVLGLTHTRIPRSDPWLRYGTLKGISCEHLV
jgi:hypothetical protein